MRVLHLYKDYAPVFGGIENHIRVLAEGLRADGVDARVLVTNTGPHTVQETIARRPRHQDRTSGQPVVRALQPGLFPRSVETRAWRGHRPRPRPLSAGGVGPSLFGRGQALCDDLSQRHRQAEGAGRGLCPLFAHCAEAGQPDRRRQPGAISRSRPICSPWPRSAGSSPIGQDSEPFSALPRPEPRPPPPCAPALAIGPLAALCGPIAPLQRRGCADPGHAATCPTPRP